MSMNLVAYDGKKKLDLLQTPTQITYTIMGSNVELRRSKATEALDRYCQWVKHSLNSIWHSEEEYQNQRELVNNHLKEIEPHLKSRKLVIMVL